MERFKSISIVILSILALILLSLNLGLSFESIFFDPQEDSGKIFDNSVLFFDVVLPEEIIVNFSDEDHTIVNSFRNEDLWQETKNLLIEVFGSSESSIEQIENISDEAYYEYINEKSIILSFSTSLNLTTILNSFDIGDYDDIVEEFQDVDSILISLKKPILIINCHGQKTLVEISYFNTDTLEESVDDLFLKDYLPYYIARDRFGGESLAYIPYTKYQNIEMIYFENILESLDKDYIENIVYEFFKKKTNQIREIDDGSTVTYTDGKKILKIDNFGLINFINPQLISSSERNLYRSIEYALHFISGNLGYDNTLYLKEIEEIEYNSKPGYQLKFGKIAGDFKALIDHRTAEEYIEINVFNNQVSNFSQILRRRKDQGPRSYYSLRDEDDIVSIIKTNKEKIQESLGENLSLDEILKNLDYARLVYIDNLKDERLSLAWYLVIDGQDFIFKLY